MKMPNQSNKETDGGTMVAVKACKKEKSCYNASKLKIGRLKDDEPAQY